MLELFAEGLEWMPGARELLATVRAAGLRTALVSNTPRMLVDVALLTIGVHHFDAVICGDEVPRTKPDPALTSPPLPRSGSTRTAVSSSRTRRPASSARSEPDAP